MRCQISFIDYGCSWSWRCLSKCWRNHRGPYKKQASRILPQLKKANQKALQDSQVKYVEMLFEMVNMARRVIGIHKWSSRFSEMSTWTSRTKGETSNADTGDIVWAWLKSLFCFNINQTRVAANWLVVHISKRRQRLRKPSFKYFFKVNLLLKWINLVTSLKF